MGRLSSSSSGGSVTLVAGSNALAVNDDGSINVVIVTAIGPTLVYNEVVGVVVGLETIVLTYTVAGTSAMLQSVAAAAENIGEVRIYKNANIISKQYLYYNGFNLTFNLANLGLVTGDIISVKGVNNGDDICKFNATLLLQEVA